MLYTTIIESSADQDTVQRDLFQLEQWVAMWQKNISPSKYNTMSITLKHQPSPYSLYMYLNTLCYTPYCWRESHSRIYRFTLPAPLTGQSRGENRANKILGVHRRKLASCGPVVKEQAYLALVCPVCGYGSIAWSPYTERYQQY